MDKRSSTEQLAADIEMLTGAVWGREQRIEVCELIRKYRFGLIAGVKTEFLKLARESSDVTLSDKIILGKF